MADLDLNACFTFSLDLAREAGRLINSALKKRINFECKSSPKDLVTETDKAVEDLVISSLKKKFPTHKFIGEETTASGVKAEFTDDPTWIIDPIDGTMNFVHKFPHCCISMALWVKKESQIGIVYNPVLDQMFTARKGQGAYLNGEKISVTGQTDISKSLISVEMGTRPDPVKMKIVFNNIQTIMSKCHGIRSMGSAALNMCYVALGATDAYYEIGIHAWDMAAGEIIIKEAGGVVRDVDGKDFKLLQRRVLCGASKELTDEIVNCLEIYEEEHD